MRGVFDHKELHFLSFASFKQLNSLHCEEEYNII